MEETHSADGSFEVISTKYLVEKGMPTGEEIILKQPLPGGDNEKNAGGETVKDVERLEHPFSRGWLFPYLSFGSHNLQYPLVDPIFLENLNTIVSP